METLAYVADLIGGCVDKSGRAGGGAVPGAKIIIRGGVQRYDAYSAKHFIKFPFFVACSGAVAVASIIFASLKISVAATMLRGMLNQVRAVSTLCFYSNQPQQS